LDARGNRGEINAQFSLNAEKLAYTITNRDGDVDYPHIHSNPRPEIIKILQSHSRLDEAIKEILEPL
jgi:2-hydroxy-3-keto-5-methylthiopentenyl-1-phosphate phosphatase